MSDADNNALFPTETLNPKGAAGLACCLRPNHSLIQTGYPNVHHHPASLLSEEVNANDMSPHSFGGGCRC